MTASISHIWNSASHRFSHGTEALDVWRGALEQLPRRERQSFLNTHLLRAPIRHEEVRQRLDSPPEPFVVLQGDVLRTDAAYVLGVRCVGDSSFALATSTCDAIIGRRETALLLPIEPRRPSDYADVGRLRSDLGNLLAFKSTRYFYLPPLPDDDPEVLFNVVRLDPLAQCANHALAVAERRASMSLIGWRVFGAVLRSLQIREAEDEAKLRAL